MKDHENDNGQSRRKFIKTGSLVTIGTIALGGPISKIISEFFEGAASSTNDLLTCELFRFRDMLHLKYYFFNVNAEDSASQGKLITHNGMSETPIYLYVELPPQHISQEFLEIERTPKFRKDFKKMRSYLAGKSWLAFKVNQVDKKNVEVKLDGTDLLDWNNKFSLITLDDVLFVKDPTSANHAANWRIKPSDLDAQCEAITNLVLNIISVYKEKHKTSESEHNRLELYNSGSDFFETKDGTGFNYSEKEPNKIGIPLSTFEVPYKMMLSPINDTDPGRYVFDSNVLQSLYTKKGVHISEIWHNNLKYAKITGEKTDPRFKIVNYLNAHIDDHDKVDDVIVKLLPAPINRMDLHNLTLLPEKERDVTSKQFEISALGISASLNYSHPDPLHHSLVAWNQEIKYAWDNFASVTYRAIDLFTGFKVLVTVLIERTYVDKVSFMRKRYFVSFAEREKVYGYKFQKPFDERDETPDQKKRREEWEKEQKATVSRTPFEKIIALSEGAYFKPVCLPKLKDKLNDDEEEFIPDQFTNYVNTVLKEGTNNPLIPENNLSFKYIGIDKEGKEHTFTSKMSIVFSERYTITKGKFKYVDEYGQSKEKTSGEVDFKYIGQLDPALIVKGTGCDIGVDVKPDEGERLYEFSRTEVFDNLIDRDKIKESISQARRIFTFKSEKLAIDRIKQFEQVVKGSLTYAKIDGLRIKNGSANSIITATSTATTFETNNLFLFSELNDGHDPKDRPYLKMHPLVPDLFQANVIIPQIDQIEGQSMLREVEFAKDYVDGYRDLDIPFDENNKYLFFQLRKKQTDFFKDNFRKAGGMVDPGISITHVSALDKGISYNDLHNRIGEQSQSNKNLKAVSSATAISSVSIFGEADAQIVGIPLRAIIDVFLSEADIPVFKFKQDLDDALNQFEKLKREFANLTGILGDLQAQYEATKRQYEDAKAQYEKAVALVEQLRKMSLYEWVETLVQQKELIYACGFHHQAIEAFYKVETAALIAECTKNLKINAVALTSLFEDFRKAVMDKPLADAEKKAAEIIKNFEGYSEEVVAVLIVEFIKQNKTLNNELRNISDPSPFLKAWKEVSKQFTEDTRLYQNLRKWDNYIKTIENLSQQYQKELTKIGEKAQEGINRALYALPEQLAKLINKIPGIDIVGKENVATFVKVLIEIETAKNTLGMFETEMRKLNYQGLEKLIFEYRSKFCLPKDIAKLETEFLTYSESFKANVIQTQTALNNQFKTVKDTLTSLKNQCADPVKDVITKFEDYAQKINEYQAYILLPEYDSSELNTVQDALNVFEKSANDFKKKLDQEYLDTVVKARGLQLDFSKYENQYKSFVTDALKQLKAEIDKKEQEIKAALSDIETYNNALQEFNQLKLIYARLSQPVNMELNYNYSYNKFRRASFAGVIDFIPNKNKTQLTVDVSYATQFQLTDLNPDGLKVTNSYHTKSSLSDFKIGLAQIIFVDFASVSFISGSDVKDDFMVKIRSVDFGGIMTFVDAFKEYLKSLDNNLVFDLNTTRAQIGYGISLPSITAGAFNFFNLSLSALLVLPFDPKKSLQMQFGFGNELNKFGITVSGIFGGQGYFILIAEPKRGIIALVIVLEFGAIFNLNLGVASGTAYLVGGIYIRREKLSSGRDLIECHAYILAVGRLRIVGLFSASLTFYVGLHGDGHILKGVATVTASKRFSRFFEISVSVSYEKILKGAKRDEVKQPNQDNLFLHTHDIYKAAENEVLSSSESLDSFDKITADDLRSGLTMLNDGNGGYNISLNDSGKSMNSGALQLVKVKKTISQLRGMYPESKLKLMGVKGTFYIVLTKGSDKFYLPATAVKDDPSNKTKAPMDSVSVEEYYASYY